MNKVKFETEATIKLKHFHNLAAGMFILVSLLAIVTIIATRLYLDKGYLYNELDKAYKEQNILRDENSLLAADLIYYRKKVQKNN
jgi:hypothetical protein